MVEGDGGGALGGRFLGCGCGGGVSGCGARSWPGMVLLVLRGGWFLVQWLALACGSAAAVGWGLR